jgi:hypothetical protein
MNSNDALPIVMAVILAAVVVIKYIRPDIVETLAHSDQLNVPDRSDGTLMELVQRTTS